MDGGRVVFKWLAIVAVLCGSSTTILAHNGHPVVLVPGDAGSQIYGKLDGVKPPHSLCYSNTADYFPLWLNLEYLVPLYVDCFAENMKLVYDNKTHTTHNTPGVLTTIPFWGNTTGIEFLDESKVYLSSYFSPIATMLLAHGYKQGFDLRGAPYDFRKAPNELEDYGRHLTELIEETYSQTGGRRVVIAAHSLGNVVLTYLFKSLSPAWKDKYVEAYVAIAAPLGGSAKIMKVLTSGDTLNDYLASSNTFRSMQRTFPSSYLLMPSPEAWHPQRVLVSGPRGNYTVRDYQKYFDDLGYPPARQMRADTEGLIRGLPHPGVNIHCVHGTGVSTMESFRYGAKGWPNSDPETTEFGDGDGTVNMVSLDQCEKWNVPSSGHSFNRYGIPGASHMSVLGRKEMLKYMEGVVFNKLWKGNFS